jgi:stress-induced-phosphoprotein 1
VNLDLAATEKEAGNAAFKAKDFLKAVEHYTEAIRANPNDHTIYGNRSQTYINLKNFNMALQDAEKATRFKPDWGKGYFRKGMALQGLELHKEAV